MALAMLISCEAQAEICIASVYGTKDKDQNGTSTASGIPLRDDRPSMAHRTYTLRGFMRITNLRTGKVTVLQVTDRGPFVHGRCADLSHEAAKQLGLAVKSLTLVKVEPKGEVK